GQAIDRRSTDGGVAPGWSASVPDERAVLALGRAVLSGGPGELDGEARYQARGWHGARPQLLPGDGTGCSLSPGSTPGRRCVLGFVLLFMMAGGEAERRNVRNDGRTERLNCASVCSR